VNRTWCLGRLVTEAKIHRLKIERVDVRQMDNGLRTDTYYCVSEEHC
jgi:aspartate 1-decarboxylase